MIDLIFGNCEEKIKEIEDNSISIILTDPPYLYLKNQKLERQFNEVEFFKQCKRVLKNDGFVILFGRGTSFYKWNTILADLNFKFKEEIIWDKSQSSSPLMNISRVHETVSIHTLGDGIINKVKIPYLEMKKHDIPSIIQDIKRLKSVFTQPNSLDAVNKFIETNLRDSSDLMNENSVTTKSTSRQKKLEKEDRCVSVLRSLKNGMNEKTIIRTDRVNCEKFTKHSVTTDNRQTGDRCVNVVQSVEFGLNEKSIIKQVRDHYTSIHPTQKPVKLIERLLNLVLKENDNVLDPFAGSFAVGVACYNLGLNFTGIEIDKEYFELGKKRIAELTNQLNIFNKI